NSRWRTQRAPTLPTQAPTRRRDAVSWTCLSAPLDRKTRHQSLRSGHHCRRRRRMILVGQYDSPFVRRVAISLRVLGFMYEHDTRSVFGDFDSMRTTNPLGRIPSLVLEDGEVLIDSAAILDWLDQKVGPARALLPASGPARQHALRLIALATGVVDKFGAAAYERIIRPTAYRWPEWIARCRTQGQGALAALAAKPWPATAALDQAAI